MFSPDLNRLIDASLTDGVLTDQERAVIKKRALLEGIDPDEVDVLLESKLQEMRQKAEEAVAKVRKCPACGAIISSMQTVCPQCGNEITSGEASKSMQKLSDMINDVTIKETNPSQRFERIKNIIKSFPVPTTKGDILDFLFLAAPNAKKKGGIFGKKGASIIILAGGAFIICFIFSFISSYASHTEAVNRGWVFSNALSNGFSAGIFFAFIAGLIAHFVLDKNVLKATHEHNRMADVWKSKCQQVIAKAKFSMKDDAEVMNYIYQIEQDINSK